MPAFSLAAVRDAFGYRGRGTASPDGVRSARPSAAINNPSIFYSVPLEEREVRTPTGEAVPPRVAEGVGVRGKREESTS